MRLGDMTFSKIVEVCDSHICSGCPLHGRHPIFYNRVTDEYEYCYVKTLLDNSVAYAVQNEELEIEGDGGIKEITINHPLDRRKWVKTNMKSITENIHNYCMNTECDECELRIDYDPENHPVGLCPYTIDIIRHLTFNEFKAIIDKCEEIFKED